MAEEINIPFSVRNRGGLAQVDNEFPQTARIGLLHILRNLVSQAYVEGWEPIILELQRLKRIAPYLNKNWDLVNATEQLLSDLEWKKAFDFCQRLYDYLAQESMETDPTTGQQVYSSRGDVQNYIAQELQLLFLEENLAFEFSNGIVRRRGRRHTADRIARAGLVLGDPRLEPARGHYNKAVKCFRNVSEPDYENAVKEAVCAVEAAAQVLFSSEGKQLDDIIKDLAGSKERQLPKPIANTFYGLYGFRNSGKGVAHGNAGTGAGAVTKEIAEYALGVTASQIVLLVNFAEDEEIPF